MCNIAKNNLCIFIEKLLDNKKNNNDLNCYIPTIKEIIIKYLDDHSQEIRNTSAKLMAYIKNNKFNLFLFIKKIFDDIFLGMINLD